MENNFGSLVTKNKSKKGIFTPPDLYKTFLIISIVVYIAYWSCVTILSYYSLNEGIFDLGSFEQGEFSIARNPSLSLISIDLATRPGVFIFFPLGYFVNYPLILFIQSFALGIAAYPLYNIALYSTKSKLFSLVISLSYLVYFPLAGVNIFMVHLQAFFIPLFIFGYWALTGKKYKTSFILILLSGLTKYPYVILIMLFSLIGILETLKTQKNFTYSRTKHYFLFLFLASVIILAYSYFYLQTFPTMTTSQIVTRGYPLSQNVLSFSKVSVLLLVLLPVAFLPIFSRKFLPMLMPYTFLVFFTSSPGFQYPSFYTMQYTSLVIPFIYLGAIDGWKTLYSMIEKNEKKLKNTVKKVYKSRVKVKHVIIIVISIFSILTMSIYTPYGPLNDLSANSYNVNDLTNVNITRYNEFSNLVNLIPVNTPYVIMQANMPQLLPRQLAYDSTPLIPYETLAYNMTHQDVNGTWVHVNADYIITDPYSFSFTAQGPYPYNLSMYQLLQELYQNGNYGVLGEASGMIVLEKNYSGPIEYYVPLNQSFKPSQITLNTASNLSDGCIVSTNVPKNAVTWYGYTFLQPGKYQIRLQMMVSNNSSYNNMVFGINTQLNNSLIILDSHEITGNNFTSINSWENITFNFYSSNFYEIGYYMGGVFWSGTIKLAKLTIIQICS